MMGRVIVKHKKSRKYGVICMSCGRTFRGGVNRDGECGRCSRSGREAWKR